MILSPIHHRAIASARHRGVTLLEMTLAMAVMSVLVVGMGSAIVLSTRAMDTTTTPVQRRTHSAEAVDQLLSDIAMARAFTSIDTTDVTFIVPDRDLPPDGVDDVIRLSWSGVAGNPLIYQINDSPRFNLVEDVHQFIITHQTRTIAPQVTEAVPVDPASWGYYEFGVEQTKNLLFVSGGSQSLLPLLGGGLTPTSQEQLRINLLESWGYTVTTISHNASQSSFINALEEADIAFVSSDTTHTKLAGKLASTTVGIVSENVRLRSELRLASDQQEDTEDDFRIASNEHYITSPFAEGSLAIFTSTQPIGWLKGTLASGLVTLGETNTTGSNYGSSLAILDVGDLQSNGTPAAGRRVQLPWGGSGFNFNALNAYGRNIMRRAVDWAAGNNEDINDTVFGYDSNFSTQIVDIDDVQIATQAVLPADGSVTKIWAYIKGHNGKRVRYAIYSDNAGEPGTLIVESSDEKTNDGTYWMSIPVASTPLTAGTYWLAISFENSDMGYQHDEGSTGQTRYRSWQACKDGYLTDWGTSDDSFVVKVAVWAEYTPD